MARLLRLVLSITQIIFGICLAHFAFRVAWYHWALLTYPFPAGLREGAMMTSTVALLKGLNPYAMVLQPQYMNQYGILYPLLVWPWAKVFGITMFVHRAVAAFFILGCCLLIFSVLRKISVSVLLSFWVAVMLYSSLTFPITSTPLIDPGSTGAFFFLLTVIIPWFCRYSYKSLIISVCIGVLAFYAKPYAFLGALIMASFLFLFVSRIKGLFYGALLLATSVVSVVAVNCLLPAYFDNCFFTSVNMAPAWSSMERLHEQMVWYWHLHQWILILIAGHLLWFVFRFFKFGDDKNVSKRDHTVGLFVYAAACAAFVLYMSLGRHSGAMLWYFFQLLSPFLLIIAAWIFNRNAFWPLICVPFLVLTLHTMTADQKHKVFDKKMANWPETVALLQNYHHVLNSPLIAPLLMEQHKDIVDDGQAEYFLSGGMRNYWMKGRLKEDDRIFVQQAAFFGNIRDMVENKQYDLIMLQSSLLPMGVAEDIRQFYKFEGQVLLYAPQDCRFYAVSVWLPN